MGQRWRSSQFLLGMQGLALLRRWVTGDPHEVDARVDEIEQLCARYRDPPPGDVLEVEQQRKDDGYRVIPLLLPGIEPSALPLWFDEEPVGVRVELKTGGVSEALPQILAALGERLPTDHQPLQSITSEPVEELLLKLSDPKIQEIDNKRRAVATATLVYEPADQSARAVERIFHNSVPKDGL
jgi:hypothetical protein